jgi:Helix-turn-helix domain of resolvase
MPDVHDEQLRQMVAEGLSQREIARRTGLARATLYRRFQRLHITPVQTPVQVHDTGAVSSVDTGAVQQIDTGAVSDTDTDAVQALDTGAVQRLDRLEGEVQGLRLLMQSVIDRLEHPPVRTPVQITTSPPYPKSKAIRWNLWLPEAIRDQLAAWATERGMSPSQLVTELLWKALNDRRSSAP